MANIHDCLQRAIDDGALDRGRGRAAQDEFADLVAKYETMMPRAQAEAQAAETLRAATKAATAERRHTVIAQMQAMVRISATMRAVSDPARALKLLLEWNDMGKVVGFTGESIRSIEEALVRLVHGGIREALEAVGPKFSGRSRDPALMNQILDELHGENTGNVAARQLADAIRSQQERLRQLFNAHGGNIGKLADFGVHHTHNVAKIRRAQFEGWRKFLDDNDMIDWGRIINHKTGKPFAKPGGRPGGADRVVFLQRIYDSITTRAWNRTEPSMTMGGKALYNTRAEHRVLHFKSGAAWRAYNKQFGSADPFSSLMSGLNGIAGDIARMRVLGPNPRLGLEFARQVAMKDAALKAAQPVPAGAKIIDYEGRVRRAASLAATMLAHQDGSVNVPVNEFWASFMGGTRNVLTGIQLGSAPLSAVTDVATVRKAALVMGLSPTNVLARHVKLLGSSAERSMMASQGYIMSSLADMGAAQARFAADTFGPEMAHRVAGITLRASGLTFWTDAMRLALMGELTSELALNAGNRFDQLSPTLQGIFSARGITAADWDKFRVPEGIFRPTEGAVFLNPIHWLEHTNVPRAEAEGLSMRVQMIVEEQLELAVPTGSLEAKAMVLGDTRPGTFTGEFLRSGMKYRGWSLSLMFNHFRRAQAMPTGMDRWTYAATLGAQLTIMGALAVQLKEMAKGRDPRPMTDGKFWLAATFQGGGLGIFGDFFAAESNRMGGGIGETLAGPVVGLASSIVRPIATNLTALATGAETHLGRDVANLLRYNTPVASSLWYARAAYDRMVADQIQLILDPDARANMRRQEQTRTRNLGNEPFYPRGALLPSRAPDLSNAVRSTP